MNRHQNAAVETTYRQHFGRIEQGLAVEVVSWRLKVSNKAPDNLLDDGKKETGSAFALQDQPQKTRPAWFGDSYIDTPVYWRADVPVGFTCTGPALFEERESTVVVPPGASVRCDNQKNLRVNVKHQN